MRGLIRVVGAGVPRSKDLLWPRLDQSNYSCFQPVEFKWSVDLKFLCSFEFMPMQIIHAPRFNLVFFLL